MRLSDESGVKDEHPPSSKIFEKKTTILDQNDLEKRLAEMDTTCGVGCFAPKWLQILASKKTYLVVYALTGMQNIMLSSYSVGILSTVEKNFHMSSRMSGMLSAAWDIGLLLSNLVITYIAAKGHRTRWVAFGMLIVSLSSFMRALPYHLYKGGETIKLYTKEYETSYNITNHSENNLGNFTDITYLRTNANCHLEDTNFSDMVAFCIFFIANILMGMGCSVYWTCGMTYLDDNARKNVVPMLLACSQALKLLGPTIGFLLSSYVLKIYVDPHLTPTISNEDPRWIGAWWLGWYPIGILGLVCASTLMLFPRILPRAALRKAAAEASATATDAAQNNNPLSLSDFTTALKRILRNKVFMCNSLSSVSFILGFMAFWTFMPKYMESQFRLSPSQSNFLTGTVSIISSALGIVVSGFVISKFQPSPRLLAGWNVFSESLDVLSRLAYIMLSCPQQTFHGHWNSDNSWNLTESCNEKLNCGTDIQYAPICDPSRDLVFYSTCHAGCTSSSMINNTRFYSNCSCIPGADTMVVDGTCPVDCSMNIILLISMMAILSFISATGRSGNMLIQFRCVEERDKSMSIGITETLVAVLGLLPAPILYGIIIDWACLVWGDNCGSRGNCWIYNGQKLRFGFNLTSAGFLLIGTILDCFVWYYVKEVKIYDDDSLEDAIKKKPANQTIAEKNEKSKENTGVPLTLLQKNAN